MFTARPSDCKVKGENLKLKSKVRFAQDYKGAEAAKAARREKFLKKATPFYKLKTAPLFAS